MPEEFKLNEDEEKYIAQMEEIVGEKLDTFQIHSLIKTRRANKDGTQFRLGRSRRPKF